MMKTGTRQPALAFDAGFITGVDEIDDQHRNLVSLANEAALVLARDPTESQVRHLVQELLSYAIYHFRTEETLMREYGYSDTDAEAAARHIDRHRRFAARVVAVQEALDRHEAVDGAALVAYLTEWIREHILGTDKLLAAFILACRSERDGEPPNEGVTPA
ncbi:MAG: hemerythrin family protein [Chromatiaceae bacterium]|nr:hemerythrin family protein [Chromatiaceae bacterium]